MSKPELLDPDLSKALHRFKDGLEARAAKDAAEPQPPAKIVQFPLPFPAETPPVCNVIARSALFAAIKSKDRRQMKKEIVASQDGVEIGSVPRRFDRVRLGRANRFGEDRASRNSCCAAPVGPTGVLTLRQRPVGEAAATAALNFDMPRWHSSLKRQRMASLFR